MTNIRNPLNEMAMFSDLSLDAAVLDSMFDGASTVGGGRQKEMKKRQMRMQQRAQFKGCDKKTRRGRQAEAVKYGLEVEEEVVDESSDEQRKLSTVILPEKRIDLMDHGFE